MNGQVISMEKGKKVYPRPRCNNLVNRCGLSKGSYVILKKLAGMDNETWSKAVKLVGPGIRKTKVSNVACVLPILFSIYLTLYI